MIRFFFAITVLSKSLGALDAGTLELAAPTFDGLTEADATTAAMGELKNYTQAGMVQFRGVVLPREDWGGLRVTLTAKSGGPA